PSSLHTDAKPLKRIQSIRLQRLGQTVLVTAHKRLAAIHNICRLPANLSAAASYVVFPLTRPVGKQFTSLFACAGRKERSDGSAKASAYKKVSEFCWQS